MTTVQEPNRTATAARSGGPAVLALRQAGLSYGSRALWDGLDLDVAPGEFVAVLGPNGAGKTSLLRTVLGQQRLTSGSMSFLGRPVRRGHRKIGYIPQQRLMESGTPLRARDMIAQGVTGHRWGLRPERKAERERIDRIVHEVGATEFADAPVAELSGGEQQRTRVGQAIAADPALLLCDEPLISLDLRHQRGVTELIDRQRRQQGAAVLFVTHDVNPILDVVDRVLYIAGGRFRIGAPDEVLRADVLSDLYGTPVDVVRTMGRIVIVGASDAHDTAGVGHHHCEPAPHGVGPDEGRF
ncbi:ABC transporter ATP-binding protein [Curtobacterium sp. MCJR17_055]|uniref:metal ABC transporter ATP-binding protein n=1 Tax=unclassified Curtobacterium TaxID=257496 RepID=UPI000D94225A|nr:MULTISPECIES: ATP-binding cassette domain-containing protein [unclassified Curtobacterium]PYY32567.1 ABC transporter ATP-binding protein [Curtobacterium sp. MCBD17_029]PYY58799.1 ABC transporter ATP-binding protein [Curtobacterium sp. MCJR17_055]PYY59660.1 ABC transporter ATP-binding protein [Curtobacterium sp. MCPF17_015]PZE91759.1 ABC transporter ATP-binding protein [Curtobacterium sp. MCBD17_008]